MNQRHYWGGALAEKSLELRRRDLQGRHVHKVSRKAFAQHGSLANEIELRFAGAVAINSLHELDSKARRQIVKVLELGIPFVIAEQSQASALAYPLLQRVDFSG